MDVVYQYVFTYFQLKKMFKRSHFNLSVHFVFHIRSALNASSDLGWMDSKFMHQNRYLERKIFGSEHLKSSCGAKKSTQKVKLNPNPDSWRSEVKHFCSRAETHERHSEELLVPVHLCWSPHCKKGSILPSLFLSFIESKVFLYFLFKEVKESVSALRKYWHVSILKSAFFRNFLELV